MRRGFLLLAFLASLAAPAIADDTPMPVPGEPAPGYIERARDSVLTALSLIGIRYKFGGDSPETGLDCSGFVAYVFRETFGKLLPRDSRSMAREGEKVAPSELQPGDLVFFNTRRAPYSHVGIYIGDQRFVHAPRRGRAVEVQDMSGPYWQQRFNGARRVNP
jgi:cell wall-associated NlpC family hydrolase